MNTDQEYEEEIIDGDEALRELGQDPDAIVGLMAETAAWVVQTLKPEMEAEPIWEMVQGFVKDGMLDDVVTNTYNKMEEMQEEEQ